MKVGVIKRCILSIYPGFQPLTYRLVQVSQYTLTKNKSTQNVFYPLPGDQLYMGMGTEAVWHPTISWAVDQYSQVRAGGEGHRANGTSFIDFVPIYASDFVYVSDFSILYAS